MLIALATSIIAAGFIYAGWTGKQGRLIALPGWLLAFASVMIWSSAMGAEFGTTYALVVFSCLVWVLVLFNTERSRTARGSRRVPWQGLGRPSAAQALRHVSLFALAVPVAGMLAIFLSILLVWLLPWSALNKVTVAIFLMPVLWGGFSAWICASTPLWTSALLSAGLLIFSSLLLFIVL